MIQRGDVWMVAYDPVALVQGHEQAGPRPALVLSREAMGPRAMVTVVPFTRTARLKSPTRIELTPPEGGLKSPSYVICEQPRTFARTRFTYKMGSVTSATMLAVEDVMCMLLDFRVRR